MVSSELTLAEFVHALGRDRPAPGCGGAAAVALAMAAACAAKAMAVSCRRRGGDPALASAAERCRGLADTALEGVRRDADHFRALLAAEPCDPRPAEALEEDAARLTAAMGELRELVDRTEALIEPDLAGDVAAALDLAEAFERIQARNLAELEAAAADAPTASETSSPARGPPL